MGGRRIISFAFIFIFAITTHCCGHIVSQMLLSLERDGQEWDIIIVVDAAYALPEFRNDADIPQPQREWLVKKTQQQHLRLRKEAATYLRESISFSYNEIPLTFYFSFPDYDHTPPRFPSFLNGGAYFNVKMSGSIPANTAGDFKLHVTSGNRPNFIFVSKQEGENGYLVVSPGESKTIFSTTASGADKIPHHGISSILKFGYLHVIPYGLDHLLFILALFLMARKWRPLLSQSLIFTLAHSVTLALTASGMLQLRQWSYSWMIEPLIALSISYVALDNIFRKDNSAYRLSVIFIFGLVHGLGFSGSLVDSIQQDNDWVLPLFMANLGVELAQITILTVAWVLTIGWWKSDKYSIFQIISSSLIAAVGVIWTIQRLFFT